MMPGLQPLIKAWKDKLELAYEQRDYFRKKAKEQEDEIEIIIEAIKRLEKE